MKGGRARIKHTLEDGRAWVRALGAAVVLSVWMPSAGPTAALEFMAEWRTLPSPY